MKMRRMLACVMALLLICSLPLAAFAEEYDLANGSITVTADDSGQYVSQEANNIKDKKQTTETVIYQTGSEPSTTNTVTINADAGATANVTLKDVNINVRNTGDPNNGSPGEAAVQITGNGDVVIELDGTNTVQSGAFRAGVEKNTIAAADTDPGNGNGKLTITDGNETAGSLNSTGGYQGAGIGGSNGQSSSYVTITGSAEVTAKGGNAGSGIGGGDYGDGSNIIISGSAQVDATGGYFAAAIGGGNVGSGSEITITDNAEVTAQGGRSASGIGGGDGGSGSKITISGSAQVDATGGFNGAGIGGGDGGSGSNINISGSAEVTATGGDYGAGIGGGAWAGNISSNITISGNAEVTAKGGISGAGIGGGQKSTSANITVSKDAQVKAQGGNPDEYWGAGAAIGNGGLLGSKGQEVTLNTAALDEGWIAKYAPGTTDLDTAIPNSLTYKDASETVTTEDDSDNIRLEAAQPATADTHGHEAGFKVDNSMVVAVTTHNYGDYKSDDNATCTHDGTESAKCTVPGCTAKLERTIPGTILEHEFVNYISDADNLATCTTDGTKTATCNNCTATKTVPDPAKGHSFTNYVSNNDATYLKDGTRTAKCDHTGCDATDTITDPGTRLPAPAFQLRGQDGKVLNGKTEQKDGVLTVTVDAGFACLTGYLGGLQALKAQGVGTIVFVTNRATSTFAVADLMATMTAGDSYTLTHDGESVTFTLGNGSDISGILK